MSEYVKEHITYFESAAGKEILTFIHNQLDTEREKAEDESNPDTAFGHSKTAKAYREIDKHIKSVMLDRNA